MVHEVFSVLDLIRLKRRMPAALLTLAHPECPVNIREQSDFVGGTEAMLTFVGRSLGTDRLPGRHRSQHALATWRTRSPATATTRCRDHLRLQ